jgi:hypothetical protein
MRDAILGLLSNEEVAGVEANANARWLQAGDEYVDLEHVELGVREASGLSIPRGFVLARAAVNDLTWRRIVTTLVPRPTLRGITPVR